MDLVASGRTVMVMMEHRDSRDRPKVVQRRSYALTGKACVDILVTGLAQFRRKDGVLTVEQVAPGFTQAEVPTDQGNRRHAATAAPIRPCPKPCATLAASVATTDEARTVCSV